MTPLLITTIRFRSNRRRRLMTVKELREALANVKENDEVRVCINRYDGRQHLAVQFEAQDIERVDRGVRYCTIVAVKR
jgi:hypothetical protein